MVTKPTSELSEAVKGARCEPVLILQKLCVLWFLRTEQRHILQLLSYLCYHRTKLASEGWKAQSQ